MWIFVLELLCLFCNSHGIALHEDRLQTSLKSRLDARLKWPVSATALGTLLNALARSPGRVQSRRQTSLLASTHVQKEPFSIRSFSTSATSNETASNLRHDEPSESRKNLSGAVHHSSSDTSLLDDSASDSDNKATPGKKLSPFSPGRPTFDSTQTVRTALEKEEAWRSTKVFGEMAISQGVLDVKASPQIVWNQIHDIDSYPGKIIWVGAVDIYHREKLAAARDNLPNLTERQPQQWKPPQIPFQLPPMPFQLPQLKFPEPPFRLPQLPQLPRLPLQAPGFSPPFRIPFPHQDESSSPQEVPNSDHSATSGFGSTAERVSAYLLSPIVPGVKVKSHLNFTFEPKHGSMVWSLDRERSNDFEDFEGHFHVAAHPDRSSNTRVFYEVGLVKPRWLPASIFGAIAKRAITDCSSWIKTESELAAAPPVASDVDYVEESPPPPDVFKPYPGYAGYPF